MNKPYFAWAETLGMEKYAKPLILSFFHIIIVLNKVSLKIKLNDSPICNTKQFLIK